MATYRFAQRFMSFTSVVLLLSLAMQMTVSDAAAGASHSLSSSSAAGRSRPANAQPQIVPPRLELVGQFGGTLTAFAVNGEWAYGGIGPRMKVFDISDPADLRIVGETAVLPAMLVDLAASGRYVYAAMRDYGIRVFDVVDPAAPVEVGSFFQADLKIRALVIEGNYIYVTHDAGLSIFDISDPLAPAPLGAMALPAPDGGRELVVMDQIVYVAAYRGGIRIVDASDPAAPVEIGFLPTAAPAQDLAVAPPYIYAVTDKALVTINAADLAAPVQLGSYPISDLTSGFLPPNVAVAGRYVYVTATAALLAFDVANPALPVQISATPLIQKPIDLIVDDRFIYAAGKFSVQLFSLQILDISTPVEMGRIMFPLSRVTDIKVAGDFVYTTDDLRLLSIFDVADPTAPTEVGHVDRTYPDWYSDNDIEVANGYAYVVNNGLLHVFNITDPAQPVGITRPLTISYVTDVAIAGDYAYAVGDFYDMVHVVGLYSIDIKDPERPELVDGIPLPWAADEFRSRTVALSGDYAYVGGAFYHWRTRYDGNLAVVDIANPAQLAVTGVTELGATWGVAVDGSYAYAVASRNYLEHYERLFVVDVRNPALPRPVGWADISGAYWGNIVVARQRAYFTSPSGLTIFDIRRTQAPVPLFTDPLMGWPTRAAVDDEHVYVGTEAAGFFIYRYVEPPALPQSWLPLMLRR